MPGGTAATFNIGSIRRPISYRTRFRIGLGSLRGNSRTNNPRSSKSLGTSLNERRDVLTNIQCCLAWTGPSMPIGGDYSTSEYRLIEEDYKRDLDMGV